MFSSKTPPFVWFVFGLKHHFLKFCIMFFSLSWFMSVDYSCIFFSLLDVEMK